METPLKRATIYLDSELHRAIKLKAAQTDRSLSDLVNEAVRFSLIEDAEDLAAVRARKNEGSVTYERFIKDLKKHGRL